MQTILVCDDDKQIVEAIDIYLTGEGYQVIKAYDGYEALDYLAENNVDLLIMDVTAVIRWCIHYVGSVGIRQPILHADPFTLWKLKCRNGHFKYILLTQQLFF